MNIQAAPLQVRSHTQAFRPLPCKVIALVQSDLAYLPQDRWLLGSGQGYFFLIHLFSYDIIIIVHFIYFWAYLWYISEFGIRTHEEKPHGSSVERESIRQTEPQLWHISETEIASSRPRECSDQVGKQQSKE